MVHLIKDLFITLPVVRINPNSIVFLHSLTLFPFVAVLTVFGNLQRVSSAVYSSVEVFVLNRMCC